MKNYRNFNKFALAVLLVLTALYSPGYSEAAMITIMNADGPGEGFNDGTGVASIGGNIGTTLGAQRLNVFERAAKIWGDLLESGVDIKVQAKFDPLFCTPTSAVLGSAGTNTVIRDFPEAEFSNTWYPEALANKLAGVDLVVSGTDMSATFNSSIDDPDASCLGDINWYLGLDGNNGTDIDLLDVVLHEIGHGLGFATFVNETTGQRFLNRDDIFMKFLEDHSRGRKLWSNMNNRQRKQSAVDTDDLHWVGSDVVEAAGRHVEMYAPDPVEPGSSVSHWSTSLDPDELMEPFITDPPIHDPGLAFNLMIDLGWGLTPPPPTDCGNGVIEGFEECDGANLGNATCADFGFTDGSLTCSISCNLDTSGCTTSGCVPTHPKEKGPRCSDNIDNDCDGLIDGLDLDCK